MTKSNEKYDPLESYAAAAEMPWEGDAAASGSYDFGTGVKVETRVLRVGGMFGRRVMDFRKVPNNIKEPVDGKKEEKMTQKTELINSANANLEALLAPFQWEPSEANSEFQQRATSFRLKTGKYKGRELQARQYRTEDEGPFRNVVQVLGRSAVIVNAGWHPEGHGDPNGVDIAEVVLKVALGENS